ncbi:hypothetical protein BH09VER1_BH09VER1_22150 [soil metagenome]
MVDPHSPDATPGDKPVGFWRRLAAGAKDLSPVSIFKVALGFWIAFALIVAIVVAVKPSSHTATLEYQKASANWWKGKDIYRNKNGYLYLPQEAILYTPYELLPDRVGEPLWRVTILALLGWSLWQTAGVLASARREQTFLLASLIALPSCLSSAQNGQVNMPLAALYLLTAVALARKRWNLTALILIVALALKPISIVPILLVGALYAKTRLPLLVGFVLLYASAFLHPSPAYVQGQYELFVTTLLKAGKPTGNTWCDYAGIFRTTCDALPQGVNDFLTPYAPIIAKVNTLIRAVAALLTFGLCWWVTRSRDAVRAAFTVLLLAVIYLMLFNPRTEANSYVMMGAFTGLWAGYELTVGRRPRIALWLIAFALVLGVECYGWPIFPYTDHWAKALATIALALWLALKIATTPKGEPVIMLPARDEP